MATLYVFPSVALLIAQGQTSTILNVNPGVGAWVFVIVANLLHLTFLATFAFRYLSISDTVPDAPEPKARRSRTR